MTSTYKKNQTHNRSGLSLLELLVVLTILIALGGIVVSTLPGMLRRTQVATAAANVPEIDATIRRMAMLTQGRIGNRFDSLVTGSTGLDGEIPSYIGGAENFQTASLSPLELEALREIGITELVPATSETDNATFGSHDQSPVVLTSDSKICKINASIAQTLLQQDWNLDPVEGASYAVFGLGEQCSLVGAGAQAAFTDTPVHFSDDRLQSPENMYARYLLIVELRPKSDTQVVARFIGSAIPGRNGIHSVSKELEDYYSGN